MKQAIRVRGWISTANLINPRKLLTDELSRYYLTINPESPMVFDELQQQVDQQKREAETPYSSMEDQARDEIVDGCKVIFQTTIEPRLERELKQSTHDDELIGKFVQVVGHLHILKIGQAILSMHIVEPAFHSLDGFDPIA